MLIFINIRALVNNINFDIGENEIIGLLGPNGCGKTTTIAMILGLLKPTKGKILINKKNIENHRIELCWNWRNWNEWFISNNE